MYVRWCIPTFRRKLVADQAEALTTAAQNALMDKTKQLELRELFLKAREQEFEAIRLG